MPLCAPLGIFGGTFDPIHHGHIYPVQEAAEKVNIQKIAVMPCFIPSHKNPASASSKDRLTMVELVCAQHPLFYPDARDILRNKPTFSIDSLTEIRQEKPTTPLCFFIGTDSLQNLCSWYQWQGLFTLCHFVVCERKGQSIQDLDADPKTAAQLQALLNQRQTFNPSDLHNHLAGHIYVANTQALTVSSSHIRQLLAENQSVDTLLPTEVLDYIQQHKLYQPSADIC